MSNKRQEKAEKSHLKTIKCWTFALKIAELPLDFCGELEGRSDGLIDKLRVQRRGWRYEGDSDAQARSTGQKEEEEMEQWQEDWRHQRKRLSFRA